jgi:hypothetical protein
MDRIKQMKQLKEKGFSYGSISKLFNISRQRVHQLISGYISPDKQNKGLNKLFEFIFERDNKECQICGRVFKTIIKSKNNLLIHHIDKNWNNNNPNNLICLCNNCHLRLHGPRTKQNFKNKFIKKLSPV